jgi:hypothetical protein
MAIKHKRRGERPIVGGDWDEDHEVEGLLGALLMLAAVPNTLPYIKPDQSAGTAAVTAFGLSLLSVLSSADLRTALDAVSRGGDTMAGHLAFGGHKITGLGEPENAGDAATKSYVDAIAALASGALVFKGAWDASSNVFPGGGTAQTGYFYKVSVAGTVDGKSFDAGDEIFAIADDASVATYGGNWLKIEGSISLAEVQAAIGFAFGALAALDDIPANKINDASGDGRSLIKAADYAAMRALLGLGSAAVMDVADLGDASTYDYLVNGCGAIKQTGATSASDGAYGHDQWVALTQTASIGISTLADVEDGLPSMIRLTQSQASAQRMGYIQPLEAGRVRMLRGKPVNLVLRLRNSTGAAIRYAIVEHTGTADELTKDIVNDWTSGNYTTGNFFASQSGNITVRAVGTVTPASNTLTDAVLGATLGSTYSNLYVFVWTEGAAAQNSTLDIAANLREGAAAAPVRVRPRVEEIELCRRYWQQSYFEGVPAGTPSAPHDLWWWTEVSSVYNRLVPVTFAPTMRGTPTVTLYSSDGTVGYALTEGGVNVPVIVRGLSPRYFTSVVANSSTGVGYQLRYHYTAGARL